jgi:hypothetical protein
MAESLGLDDLCGTGPAFDALESLHTAWYDDFQNSCPWSCSKAELADLAQRAPTPFAKGLMWGLMSMRQAVANHSGIAF